MRRLVLLVVGTTALVLAAGAGLVGSTPGETRTFTVSAASQVPTATGIAVPEAGVTVSCSGQAMVAPGQPVTCDSPGSEQRFEKDNPLPFGAKLIAKVGAGTWQSVGSGPKLIRGSGQLQLMFNDSVYSDNSGSFTVTVSFDKPPKPRRQECPPGEAVGRIASVRGDVLFRDVRNDWSDARAGQPVCAETEFSTDADGEVVVVLRDGSSLRVAPVSQVVLCEQTGTCAGDQKIQVLLKSREIAAKVSKQAGAIRDFSVKTPTATASVRGTEFSVAYSKRTRVTRVSVRKGVVAVDPVGPKPAVLVRAHRRAARSRSRAAAEPLGVANRARARLARRPALVERHGDAGERATARPE